MWDNKTPTAITRARLLCMPPERVYDELKEYGAYVGQCAFGNSEVEQALFNRSDRLINLGLAQFGGTWEVQSALYKQSFAETEDPDYGRALRLGVLGNCNLICDDWMRHQSKSPLSDSELLRLAGTAGTDESQELGTLLQNPSIRVLLSDLFNRKLPFDQVAPQHFYWMIAVAAQNPCINRDDGDEPWSDSPDLTAYNLQQGIWQLMQSLPVAEEAIRAMYSLLSRLDTRRVCVPHEDPTRAILRWRPVILSEEFKKRHADYRYTTLDYAEEFCCLAAALYGRWYDRSGKEARTVYIGSADSRDLVLRCAYYGHVGAKVPYGETPLTADQMKQMHDKDGDAFTLAALCNTSIIRNPKTRAVFEDCEMLAARRTGEYGDFPNLALRDLYALRYKEVLGLEPPPEQDKAPSTPELEAIARIESGLASLVAVLGQRLKAGSIKMWWALALLVLLLIVLWSRRF